jgi:hypothetical protein
MPVPHDWETPLAEIRSAAHTLDFLGEGQDDAGLRESLWLLARVLRERADAVQHVIHARESARRQQQVAGGLH